jgi:hypothetical protein
VLVFSKCIAGGLSAALVLLWWPQLVPGASLSAWLGRGVAFTLAFELMLLALRPLEETLWGTRPASRVRERLDTASERLRGGDTVRRLGSSAAIAAVALTVPSLLIVAGLSHQPPDKPGKAARAVQIVHVTKVVRPVTVQRVVAQAEVPTPVVAAPAPAPRAKAAPVKKTKTTTEVEAPAKKPATTRDSQPTSQEKSSPPKAQANGSSAKRDSVQTSLPS